MEPETPNPTVPPSPLYGFPQEWSAFAERQAEFTKRFINIDNAIKTAFQRLHKTSTMTERTIYFLGRLGVEEFMEILLLSANGYGIGAQKIVRGMYERAVTARYLHKFPAETENYLAYKRVADHKLLRASQTTMGSDVFSEEQSDNIVRDFEAVKERFTISECRTCKTTRLNHSWSKVDIISMARMADTNLWKWAVPGYYRPMQELHSSLSAIFSRLDPDAVKSGEGLIFDGAAQPERADEALVTGFYILLNILDLQQECFRIEEFQPLLQTCVDDFMIIMRDQKPIAASTPASR